jgi:hypothetical protein
MKLESYQNSKTIYSLQGNQKIIRDTFVLQKDNIQPDPIIEEVQPEIKVVMSGEPSLEIISEELSIEDTQIKKTKKK